MGMKQWLLLIIFAGVCTSVSALERAEKKASEIYNELVVPGDRNNVVSKGAGGLSRACATAKGIMKVNNPRKSTLPIYFDYDSATIKAESFNQLDELGMVFTQNLPKAGIVIIGHTDTRGEDAYNLRLSRQRALSVYEFLNRRFGIQLNRMDVGAKGESEPAIRNAVNEQEHKYNRRVEIVRDRTVC